MVLRFMTPLMKGQEANEDEAELTGTNGDRDEANEGPDA